ncbi:PREDICTED: uncharacterized protein LOC106744751 [Dinoponera quadriceps]|uniref:Dynein axonemal assembly factor 1 homolog n=1 Tax=Dinoponera quadriceps TaxID=609295 RepID=A0A6P3XBI1_DINQU|nr:PREDICTED: uncharacterized protein LOC106744751 [Dinoponera quadriceps]
MNASESDNNRVDNAHDLSLDSSTRDKYQESIVDFNCKNVSTTSEHEVVEAPNSIPHVSSLKYNLKRRTVENHQRELINNCIDSMGTSEENNIFKCTNAEENMQRKEMKLEENVITYMDDVEKPVREELDNVTSSTIESDDYYMNDNESLKVSVNLLKCTREDEEDGEGKTEDMPSAAEDDTGKVAAEETKETNRIINRTLCTSNDEQYAEKRMLEALSPAKDDMMKRIIENYTDVSAKGLQQHYSIYESSDMNLRSNSKYAIKNVQGDTFLPCLQVVSEIAIAKEDILKTIKEAEKILTNNRYWDTSQVSINQAADNHIKDNSPERLSGEAKSDEELETVNETKKNFVTIEDITVYHKLPNVKIERVVASESDVVQSNLQRLAEITCPDRPKSLIEIHETIEKIAEEKRRIENRKKESLEALSRKFDEIEKLVVSRNDTSYTSDNDPCEGKIPNDDSDSLDESQVEPKDLEVPLTKSEITENLKIEELERQLAIEVEEHKRLMDEYQKMIFTDSEVVQEASLESEPTRVCNDENVKEASLESEPMRVCNDENVNEEFKAESKHDEQMVEEFQNATSEPVDDATLAKVEPKSDDSFSDFHEEPERAYIKGKVYDFDEKQHGVRMTEELIKKHCKEHKLYQTPYLNDVLYLHYKGFSFIENLEKYTGLKCLWLENNGIREIANLDNQKELKCLFLHHNLIKKIENLDCLTKLDTLNLSHNTIRRIENLDNLKFLNTLNLSHNYLHETADIEHLRLLHVLTILDISYNRIDACDVVDILGDMKSLRVVTLIGNPVLKLIKIYRKTMILKCKNLQYLDDRPVFPRDRACAEAWMRGGVDEEVAERNRWIQAEQKKINDSVAGE